MSSSAETPRAAKDDPGVVARSLWYVKPGVMETRSEKLRPCGPGEARVETVFSFVSRGTERLVALGKVPQSEWPRMRAPFQSGEFPFPVKYGYSAAGRVVAGSAALIGKNVFCLHPHQDCFQVPEGALVRVPDAIPLRRATLGANMETALNAHWDAQTSPGERVLVIGAGIVGLLTAYLAKSLAGDDVWITDCDPRKGALAASLGIAFVGPGQLPPDCDVVFHTSATAEGLQTAIDVAANEARIIEMSWYGDLPVTLLLGGTFHAHRLRIVSSQVGQVAPSRRSTHTHHQRLTEAIALLDNPLFDTLVVDDIAFGDAAAALPQLLTDRQRLLLPVIRFRN